jgi:L-amino acid N-acyltransferase YncA
MKERQNKDVLTVEHGFCVYSFANDYVYLEDIYVDSDFRSSGAARAMADSVADMGRAKGLKKMLGSVVPGAPGATHSLRIMLKYGFVLDSATDNFIVLKKEI